MTIMTMTTRSFFALHFLACVLILGVAYFLEYGLHQEPCPLCIVERMVIMVSLGISALAILHNPRPLAQKIYSLFNSAVLTLGVGLAARHLYLQSLPIDQIPECLPGFDYLIKNFPPTEVIKLLFQGSGQCAQVGDRFIGLSLSQWSFAAFVVLLFWNLAPLVGALKLTSKNTSL